MNAPKTPAIDRDALAPSDEATAPTPAQSNGKVTQPLVDRRIDPALLVRSNDHCKQVARAQARNFYYGMKLTPPQKRAAMYAVYAWMRMADDLADDEGTLDEKRTRLEQFSQQTHTAIDSSRPLPDGLMWPAFREAYCRYEIDRALLDDMVAGQLLDQEKTTCADFDELRDYCYKVAGTVGLVCIQIWGYEGGEATRKLAEKRGLAFQLTNILRDITEDVTRGRCYLPQDELAEFGLDVQTFAKPELTTDQRDAFIRFMAYQTQRARELYDASEALDERISADSRACSRALMQIYRSLLDKIAAEPERVLRERMSLSNFSKAWIGLRASIGR